jgi:uncharacterized membrane protein YcaP (DUF421 family)
MWFDSWSDLGRVLLVGAAAYVTLVVVLRVSGKRTLSKLNAFDLVVTVALGSTLATILLSKDVSWSEGVLALALLAVLQMVVASTSRRLPGGRSFVTAPPTVLLRDGVLREDVMLRERITRGELRQAVRSSGSGGFDTLAMVVLESDGSLSVVPTSKVGDGAALEQLGP